jgi:hypothetical protein
MPFFNQQAWMTDASRVWVWFVLTVPSTALAVLFYVVHSKRVLKRRTTKRPSDMESGGVEMDNH